MAHFRATIKGRRGTVSRLGDKTQGLYVTADGWDFGVSVKLFYNKNTKKDTASIFLTSGAGSPVRIEFLRDFTIDNLTKE